MQHFDARELLKPDFRWQLPPFCNLAEDACCRHPREWLALIEPQQNGKVRYWQFGELADASARLANVLTGLKLATGARVAILMGQRAETGIAHLAVWRAGMISVPLFILFGADALSYRLQDSGAELLITDQEGLARLENADLSSVRYVLLVDGEHQYKDRKINGVPIMLWDEALSQAQDSHAIVKTKPDTPALIIYTSGTTGPPKGALHGHKILRGHIPGVCLPHNLFPQPGDCFWTPADWAWIGGLFDVLMPSWFFGVAVVAWRAAKFDPEQSAAMMHQHGVRNVFMPPTALRLWRAASVKLPQQFHLRSLGSGGETLGSDMIEWGREHLGVTINEFYGQTECNLVVGNCAETTPIRPRSMGQAIAGHRVSIIDESGTEVAAGESGQIAIHRDGGGGDAVMFLGYWQNATATKAKFCGDWLCTGDMGLCDEDGYFYFVGRDDDVISSGGYRIGPGEIEECLLSHQAIALAGVIGIADELRGMAILAAVVLKTDIAAPAVSDLQDYVRKRLAAHEYPRYIIFVDSLPQTATGKIRRGAIREMVEQNPHLLD